MQVRNKNAFTCTGGDCCCCGGGGGGGSGSGGDPNSFLPQ